MIKQCSVSSGHIVRDPSVTNRSSGSIIYQAPSSLTTNTSTGLPGLHINGHQLNNQHQPLSLLTTEDTVKKRWPPRPPSSPRRRPPSRGTGVYLSELQSHLNTRRCREALRHRPRPPAPHHRHKHHQHQTINSNNTPDQQQEGRPVTIQRDQYLTKQRDLTKYPVPGTIKSNPGLHHQQTESKDTTSTIKSDQELHRHLKEQREPSSTISTGSLLPKRKAKSRRSRSRKGYFSKRHITSSKVKGSEAGRRASQEDRLPLVSPSPPASIHPSTIKRVVVRRVKSGGATRRRAKPGKAVSAVQGRGCTSSEHVSSRQGGSVVPHPPPSGTNPSSSSPATTWAAPQRPYPFHRQPQRPGWPPQSSAVTHLELTSLFARAASLHRAAAEVEETESLHQICPSCSEAHTTINSGLVLTPKEKRAVVGYFFKKNIVSFLSGDHSAEVLNTTSEGGSYTKETTQGPYLSDHKSPSSIKLSPIVATTNKVMANETEQQENMAKNKQNADNDVKQVKGYRKKGLVNEKVLLERLSDMSIEDDALNPVIVLSSVDDDASPMEAESEPTKTSGRKKGNMKQMNSLSLDVPCLLVGDEPKRPPM